jgi:Ca-activated chloride channel homolog
VDVGMVSVTAVVEDASGAFIRGLGPADVEVREDGVVQQVSYFREASGPGEKIAEFTDDVGRLEQFVEALQAWGGTSLYDAVHYGLNRIKDQPGRKALIVFSDGDDTTSGMKEREVIDYARAVEATVYCVGIRGGSGLLSRGPRGFLRNVAKETGGAFFFPERVGELIRIFSGISDELHNHYLLGYVPQRMPDGTWRAIEVRLRRKGASLRVRKGYFAVTRRPVAGQ